MTLIAEDVLLLLLDDRSGKPLVDSAGLARVLAGAVILELVLDGHVRVTGDGEDIKKGRLVSSGPAPADATLARVWDVVTSASRPLTPKKAIEKTHRGLQDDIATRLVEQGFVDRSHGKVLGIFPTRSLPARDTSHEDAVRADIRSVLVDEREPSARTGALVALLTAVDAVPKVLPGENKKAIKNRAADVAATEWAAAAVRTAVRESVDAVHAAVIAAVVASAVVTTT